MITRYTMCYGYEKVGNMFLACCVLHNLAHHVELLLDTEVPDTDEDPISPIPESYHNERGHQVRKHFI